MVDFQSRDTRRAAVDDGNGDDEGTDDGGGGDGRDGGRDADDGRGHEGRERGEGEHDRSGDGNDEGDRSEHHHHEHDVSDLGVAVLTVSSSRSLDDDPSGDAIVELVEEAGHEVVVRELVPDEYDRVQRMVNRFIDRDDTNVIVTTGGTGVTNDDVTIEAASALFEKELPGFGELFRRLSYDEIGTRVVGTRATAGTADSIIVFCLPGSENAARLGVEEILLPEAGHLAGLVRRE